MKKTKYIAGLLVVLLILEQSTAQANMRAPELLPQHGASSFISPDIHLTVQKEALTLRCDLYSCDVIATYSILSDTADSFLLQFISASAQLPIAEVNTNQVSVSLTELESSRPGHSYYKQRMLPTWQAEFRAQLVEGTNNITVRHQQPLGLSEYSYGYFSSSKYSADFRYEAWPLKEWNLAPDFTLTLRITTMEQRGFWQRLFRKRASVKCYPLSEEGRVNYTTPIDIPLRVIERAKSQTTFETELGLDFPERLWCSIKSRETTRRGRKKHKL